MAARHALSKRLAFAVAIAAALLLAVLYAPRLARRWMSTPPPTLTVTPETAVEPFLARALPQIGAQTLTTQTRAEDAPLAVYRLPAGLDPLTQANLLRAMADEAGVEAYVSQADGLDARVRIYQGATLHSQFILVPDLPDRPPRPRTRGTRDHPMVAVIITGLGPTAARAVIDTTAPLTLAIRPFEPFSLRLAQDGALRWQEILVQLTDDPPASRRALPYVSGAFFPTAPTTLPADQPGVIVLPAGSHLSGGRVLQVQQRGHNTAQELLTRTCYLAIRDGVAALSVVADDPGLGDILRWAEGAEAQGYRLLFASEAIRADEIRGAPWGGVSVRPGAGRVP